MPPLSVTPREQGVRFRANGAIKKKLYHRHVIFFEFFCPTPMGMAFPDRTRYIRDTISVQRAVELSQKTDENDI